MNIIYKDEDIIVCIKPYGILTQSDSKGNKSAVDILKEITNSDIYPVHRLDKTTGGVMVFALNPAAAANLSQGITNGMFNKEYLAVISGKPDEAQGVFNDLLYFDRNKNKSYVVKRKRAGVKNAELEYTLIESKKIKESECSLVKIKLMTGRTHQIRVQFASRGMSLCGDRRYGGSDICENIALWSHSLSFYHPVSKELLNFTAPPENEIFKYFSM